MIRRTLSTQHRLIPVTSPRYRSRQEWLNDLVNIAHEIVCMDARCRAAAALAPVALWATRTRDPKVLCRIASEVVRHGDEWEVLRPLGLQARAVLAAEPVDEANQEVPD